jgi:hypothetical protein
MSGLLLEAALSLLIVRCSLARFGSYGCARCQAFEELLVCCGTNEKDPAIKTTDKGLSCLSDDEM